MSVTDILLPIYSENPSTFQDLVDVVSAVPTLTDSERKILIGVFRHLPSTHHSLELAGCIPRLTPNQLKLLADIFADGLLEMQRWPSLREDDDVPAQHLRFHFPSIIELLINLDITDPFPTPYKVPDAEQDTPSMLRTRDLSRSTLNRQDHVCAITGDILDTGSSQLTPHCLIEPNQVQPAFWLLISVVMGRYFRDMLYHILCGPGTYSTTNAIGLCTSMLPYYDNGTLLFLPHTDRSLPFDAATCTQYDIALHWRGPKSTLKRWQTVTPKLPGRQIFRYSAGLGRVREGNRQVEDKDVYRLSTRDPVNYPLPHPLLLSIHAMLWRMTTAAGLDPVVPSVPSVPSSTQGKRRVNHTNNRRSAKRRAKDPVSPPHTPLSPPQTPVSRVPNTRNTPGTKKAYPQDLWSLLEDESDRAAENNTEDENEDEDKDEVVKPVVSAAIKPATHKSLFSATPKPVVSATRKPAVSATRKPAVSATRKPVVLTTRQPGSRREAPIVIGTDDEDETPPTPTRIRTRTSPRTRTRTPINLNTNSDDENKSDDEAGSEYFPE